MRQEGVLVTWTLAGRDMSLCDGWQFGHLTTGRLLPLTCFCGVFWEISFPAASKRLPSTFRKCDFDEAFISDGTDGPKGAQRLRAEGDC